MIAFTGVEIRSGLVQCEVTREGVPSGQLDFELPLAFAPQPDLVAAALATLAGPGHNSVRIDLPLGPAAVRNVRATTGSAEIICFNGPDIDRVPGSGHALSFSGGFDSMAAYELIPEATIISLDFGGAFARERPMFTRFNPFIVRSNLVDLGLNRNHWSFMGIGPILMRDALEIGTYSFGSIQAGSLPKLFTGRVTQDRMRVPSALDMKILNPVAGISEVGAISIVLRTKPELATDILESVSSRGEPKYLRKRLMVEAAAKRDGLNIELPEVPSSYGRKVAWGQRFADDLSALYVIKQLGPERISMFYKGGVPDAVVQWVSESDLTFMERFNPQAYSGLERFQVSDIYARLINVGIEPYERRDWFEAAGAMKAIRGTL